MPTTTKPLRPMINDDPQTSALPPPTAGHVQSRAGGQPVAAAGGPGRDGGRPDRPGGAGVPERGVPPSPSDRSAFAWRPGRNGGLSFSAFFANDFSNIQTGGARHVEVSISLSEKVSGFYHFHNVQL